VIIILSCPNNTYVMDDKEFPNYLLFTCLMALVCLYAADKIDLCISFPCFLVRSPYSPELSVSDRHQWLDSRAARLGRGSNWEEEYIKRL
jgi:hypothetical protein